MLRDNSAAIQQQAASATIGLPQLQAAFANIYATMDSIDAFKLKALDTMGATITTLEGEVTKSREYLDQSAGTTSSWRPARSTSPRAVRPAPCAEPLRCYVPTPPSSWASRTGSPGSPARPAGCSAPVMPVTPAAPTEADVLAALDRVQSMIAGGVVPAAVASRVARVSTTVRDTMPRLRNLGLGSPEAYSVMATATDYLPEAIGGYTRLPRQWADSRPIENGKTSLMLLIDQLDLLGATMDKIFDAVVQVDADALIGHGRFLQEKFGHASTGGSLDLGQQAPPHPAPWTCRDLQRGRRPKP